MNTATQYKLQTVGVKYGYQFPLLRRLALVPQVGYAYSFLSAHAVAAGNTTYGNGASSQTASLGLKFLFVPVQHVYLFAAPEYGVALAKDANFKTIGSSADFGADGFAVHAGLLLNF